MDELRGRPLFTLFLTLHPPDEVGAGPAGSRRVFPFSGGTFVGDRLRGVVAPHGGHDWLFVRPDGASQQDARATLRTDDGGIIIASYRGVRHLPPEQAARQAAGETIAPSDYYHRVAFFFETGDSRYTWMNLLIAVGLGERLTEGVRYRVFEVS